MQIHRVPKRKPPPVEGYLSSLEKQGRSETFIRGFIDGYNETSTRDKRDPLVSVKRVDLDDSSYIAIVGHLTYYFRTYLRKNGSTWSSEHRHWCFSLDDEHIATNVCHTINERIKLKLQDFLADYKEGHAYGVRHRQRHVPPEQSSKAQDPVKFRP